MSDTESTAPRLRIVGGNPCSRMCASMKESTRFWRSVSEPAGAVSRGPSSVSSGLSSRVVIVVSIRVVVTASMHGA